MDIKELKTLQLTDYAQLIEDINYNFAVLLSSPLFVGSMGKTGEDGVEGAPGIRGSKWMFCNILLFMEQWPEDNIVAEYQITINYLNSKLDNEIDRNKLLIATNAGELFVNGDVFVVNSKIYSLDLETNKFIDTHEYVNSNNDTVLGNINEYVVTLVNNILKNDPTYISIVQNIASQTLQAKNYLDSSGNVNNTILDSSILDVTSTSSKPGVEISNYKVFLPSSKILDDTDIYMSLVGGTEFYHKLVQETIAYNNSVATNSVSTYGPTYLDPPSMVMLQNTQTSGFLFGYKKATNFNEFGKLYINNKLELVLQSPNVSDYYGKFSQILMTYDTIILKSDNLIYDGNVTFTGDVKIPNLSQTISTISNDKEDEPIMEVSSLQHMNENNESFNELHEQINIVKENVNKIENTASTYYASMNKKMTHVTNTSKLHGSLETIVLLNNEELCWDEFKELLFDENGIGKTNVSYTIPGNITYENIDLSNYMICDNNFLNLMSYDKYELLDKFVIQIIKR